MRLRVVCHWAWTSTGRRNFHKWILEKKRRDAAIHLLLYIRMMVGNHSKWAHGGKHHQTTGKYHITGKNKSCLPVYSLVLFGVTRSLITFVCPWQTPVPRTHHTEPRSAFDIPLITSGGKAKTFTLWLGGVGGKRASILQKQHLQDGLVSKKLPKMTEL